MFMAVSLCCVAEGLPPPMTNRWKLPQSADVYSGTGQCTHAEIRNKNNILIEQKDRVTPCSGFYAPLTTAPREGFAAARK
jgi:hypothetical protein